MNIEPFLEIYNNGNIKFFYREDYQFPDEIEDESILFLFSDHFRVYSKENFQNILNLLKLASRNNRVILTGDLLFHRYYHNSDFPTVNSFIDQKDYNLELGYYSQFPFNKSGKVKIENLIAQTAGKIARPIMKAVFVDLDNTLIPGVWEEDKQSIQDEYASYKNWRFQRLLKILLKCHSHGSQIIVVSKNDKESIIEALDFIYPRWKRFVTHIDSGWAPKGERILANIEKMNIGPQDCLFIDDNGLEIKNVKRSITGIEVIEFGSKESLELIEKACIYGIEYSKDMDSDRNLFYGRALGSNEDRRIAIESTKYDRKILCNNIGDFARIKELSVKTNQMNFYKKEIIKIDLDKYMYYSIHCVTEFSNLGMIGYYVVNTSDMFIENFVMSCRALGFGLENEFLENALEHSNRFCFRETSRNNVAKILIENYTKDGRIIVQSA